MDGPHPVPDPVPNGLFYKSQWPGVLQDPHIANVSNQLENEGQFRAVFVFIPPLWLHGIMHGVIGTHAEGGIAAPVDIKVCVAAKF